MCFYYASVHVIPCEYPSRKIISCESRSNQAPGNLKVESSWPTSSTLQMSISNNQIMYAKVESMVY